MSFQELESLINTDFQDLPGKERGQILDKHKALIDNRDILHHMFVFFCFDGVANTNEGDRLGDAPYVCDGAESSCTQVATWAVGPEEECLPPTIGKKFDFTGMDKVIVKIEAHLR